MAGTTSTTSVLDEAFERMAASSAFELPNGFVNHGPMGVEALAALGLEEQIDEWARRFERVPGAGGGRRADTRSGLEGRPR
jgi:hypothetical protein